jgi:hypothetical protein
MNALLRENIFEWFFPVKIGFHTSFSGITELFREWITIFSGTESKEELDLRFANDF